jgi:Zn-finger nucleic acid-binding protein
MKCGKCGGDLSSRLFKGVEIDICADCGAVLLDPGELEQLAGQETDQTILTTLAGFFTLGSSK